MLCQGSAPTNPPVNSFGRPPLAPSNHGVLQNMLARILSTMASNQHQHDDVKTRPDTGDCLKMLTSCRASVLECWRKFKPVSDRLRLARPPLHDHVHRVIEVTQPCLSDSRYATFQRRTSCFINSLSGSPCLLFKPSSLTSLYDQETEKIPSSIPTYRPKKSSKYEPCYNGLTSVTNRQCIS